jgi:signal transduction histidine kinase
MPSLSAVNRLKGLDLSRIALAPAMLGAAFALLAVTVMVSISLLAHTQHERDRLVQTIDTQTRLDALLASMRAMESGQRGYLLSGDPQFLGLYNETRTTVFDQIKQIEGVFKGTPSEENAQRLKAEVQSKTDEMAETLKLHDAGERDRAVSLVRSAASIQYMDGIRNTLEEISRKTAAQRHLQHDAAQRQETWLLAVNGVSVTLILVLAAMSLLVVRRANATTLRAQQVLTDANAELEASVAARTAELTAANEEIQKFAYIVSHDLRSPLVNIMGFTSELESLKSELFPPHGDANGAHADAAAETVNGASAPDPSQLQTDFEEALTFIKASISKMDRLITAVLTISREGNRVLQPERIDMNELFETITSAVAHQAQEAGASIEVASLPTIVSDRLAIEQVFSNLVDNALKYLREDVEGKIRVNGKQQGSKIVVEVSDNGRGIAQRDQSRIFELFRRAGVQDRPGEGMGLAHVRALVRRLGGSIALDSNPGEGSVFRVSLPRTLAKEAKRMSA